jgi:hypothetical protein
MRAPGLPADPLDAHVASAGLALARALGVVQTGSAPANGNDVEGDAGSAVESSLCGSGSRALALVEPFLRRAAMLATICFPTLAARGVAAADAALEEDEFDPLAETLARIGLAGFGDLYRSVLPAGDDEAGGDRTPSPLIDQFVAACRRRAWTVPLLPPATPPALLPPPDNYHTLFHALPRLQCPRCQTVPSQPAICLCCGRVVCMGGACCRARGPGSRGEASAHGGGVYLVVRATTVLVIRGERGAFSPSPYLDRFGEEDTDMQRGAPLSLSSDRFARIEAAWAGFRLEDLIVETRTRSRTLSRTRLARP